MNMRFISLALFATSAYAMMHDMMTESGFLPRSAPSSVPSTSSVPAAPMIGFKLEGSSGACAFAHVSWPKGALKDLEAGECAMIVKTNVDTTKQTDTFNLLTVPDRITNGIAEEIYSDHWVISGSDATRCKAAMAGMLVQLNRTLIAENAMRYPGAPIVDSVRQHITALSVVLAYNGTIYWGRANKEPGYTQLVPLMSTDDITETKSSSPVTIVLDRKTGKIITIDD